MRVLDLFSGIGGFSLAAHWMGWETAAFVEWEEFPQKVLRKNFPNVPIYGDIKEFHYEQERKRIGPVDLVCGGFPCQPFSTAGKRKGRDDERHLWPEMLRVVRETQPTFVVGENVAGIVSMDGGDLLEEILLDLESEGYEVQPFVIPAISVGAPHRRDRIWIVAYSECNHARRTPGGLQAQDEGEELQPQQRMDELGSAGEVHGFDITNTSGIHVQGRKNGSREKQYWGGDFQSRLVGVPNKSRLERHGQLGERTGERPIGSADWQKHWYEVAARFCRVDDGLPGGVDIVGARDNRAKRLKALGNSIVPQVAYEVFRAIKQTYL